MGFNTRTEQISYLDNEMQVSHCQGKSLQARRAEGKERTPYRLAGVRFQYETACFFMHMLTYREGAMGCE